MTECPVLEETEAIGENDGEGDDDCEWDCVCEAVASALLD